MESKIYNDVSRGFILLIKKFTVILTAAVIFFAFTSNFISVSAYKKAQFIKDGNLYFIKNKNSGKYLDVKGGKDSNKQNVQQHTFNGSNAQKWQVVHTGNGVYKLVSQVGSKKKVLDIYQRKNSNKANVEIYSDSGSNDSGRRFRIIMNDDEYSYRIVSKCSNYKKAVAVADASFAQSKTVFQYNYNGSGNDEWIFEKVTSYDSAMSVNYAKKNCDKRPKTYPDMELLGGDCANFVSQCLSAGGIHYQNDWYVYRKNKNNSKPKNTTQLDNSWSLADPSPWISAVEFNKYWYNEIETKTYKGTDILKDPNKVYKDFNKGDVVQELKKNIWGNAGKAEHTMIITGYGQYNRKNSLKVSYHSRNTKDKDLLEFIEDNPNKYYRFFDFT